MNYNLPYILLVLIYYQYDIENINMISHTHTHLVYVNWLLFCCAKTPSPGHLTEGMANLELTVSEG